MNKYFSELDWSFIDSNDDPTLHIFEQLYGLLFSFRYFIFPHFPLQRRTVSPLFSHNPSLRKNPYPDCLGNLREPGCKLTTRGIYLLVLISYSIIARATILTLTELQDNYKQLYAFVNSKRKSEQFSFCFPLDSTSASCGTDITNLFCEYFHSTYSSIIYDNTSLHHPYPLSPYNCIFMPLMSELSFQVIFLFGP